MRGEKLISTELHNSSDKNERLIIKLLKEIISGVKEKVRNKIFFKKDYILLRNKEHYGKLSPEEFEELLFFDFQNHLKENPPIGEIFSREEELNKLKILPKEKKKKGCICI